MAWHWPRGDEHRDGIPAASAAPEAVSVTRSTADLTTVFSTAGAEAVAQAASRCADPATCGSEFEADGFASPTVTCTRCGLQGVLDAECVAELVAGAVIELPAGKAASRG